MNGQQTRNECQIQGCDSAAISKGYCGACYQGMRRLLKQNMGYLTAYLASRERLVTRGRTAVAEFRGKARTRRAA